MKIGTRILSLVLACIMVFTAAPQVFAATFSVGDDDQMASSWETASNNTDSENTFNMTNDINMEGHNLTAESGKTYVVNGNGHYIQNVEITGESNSDVIINANVNSSTDTALTVTGTSTTDVIVNGHVTTATEQGKNDGAAALEVANANVTVVGDVGLAVAGGSTNMNEYAVNAESGANITISGDVFSAENGVHTALGADVTIKQDLDIIGNSMIVIEDCTLTVEGDVDGGSAMIMGGNVTVGGDFDVGANIYVSNGSLTMEEGSMLEADQVHIYNHSEVDVGFIDANRVTVGTTGGEGDTSTLSSDTITNSKSNSKLEAGGKAYVEVIGDADNVTAKDNAVVVIYGNADSTNKSGNAKITTNMGASNPSVDIPKVNTTVSRDPVVKMCQGFDSGNSLSEQSDQLFDLMLQVERDLTAEMGVGAALWASLFSYNEILAKGYSEIIYTDADLNNAGSVENLKSVTMINPYYISTYKDTLAEAMSKLSPQNEGPSDVDKEVISLLLDTPGGLKDIATSWHLTTDQLTKLEKLRNQNKTFSVADAKKFIQTFDNRKLTNKEAKDLADMVNLSAEVSRNMAITSALTEAGIAVVDFVVYLYGEYKSQVAYLDNLLENQTLPPALYVAAVQLRQEYSSKLTGAVHGLGDTIMEKGAEWLVSHMIKSAGVRPDLWGAVNFGVDVFGFVSGGSKDSADLQTASAMPAIANAAMSTYQDAIRNVKNGDTSKEAIAQVKSSYVVLHTTLTKMCEIMTNLGDKEQKAHYQEILAKMDGLKLGNVLHGTLLLENFDFNDNKHYA